MSNKTKTIATKAEARPLLVPKLRFPEFRGAWEKKTLETLGYFTGGGTPSKDNAAYWTGEIPWISSSDLNEDSISQINITRFITKQGVQESATKVVPAKSILLISRVGVGKLAVSTFPLCTSQDFTNFTPTDADPLFLAYLLKSQKKTLLSFNQGTSIKGFTKDNIASLRLGFPSPAEQQKIAECLSSVDEVIAAQARKVEALKTHKKGLMQQLFPREGETQPRLRFPEFQNAGDWVRTKLGRHVAIQSGYSPSSYALSSNGEYAFVKVEDLNNCIKYQISGREFCDDSDGVVPTNSILFPKRGATIELNKIRITATNILIDTNLMALTPKNGLEAEFLYYYLSNVGLSHIADTSTIPQINNKHINPFDLYLPEEAEQQRIASCLSSLDAMITSEAQKLEALKTHKKGLMQQLFPSAEEPTTL